MINFNLIPVTSNDLNDIVKRIEREVKLPYGKSDLIADLIEISLVDKDKIIKTIINKYKR